MSSPTSTASTVSPTQDETLGMCLKTRQSTSTPVGSAASTGGRKRKKGTTSTPPPSSRNSSTTTPVSSKKKRTRGSIGTPGKVTPLAQVREKEIHRTFTDHEVSEVYKTIRKQTGSLGGNAAGGAIYGEITQASFQRVVDYLKDHCELSEASCFVDVGSGLGKPNFHVSVDPGVQVSYGIELEELRWHLSLHNLRSVLSLDSQRHKPLSTVFTAGDITHAHTFEPFSHVYTFDVGFPPDVMDKMAEMFNRSSAKYFVSFHSPRKVVETYGFSVTNIGRVATSMAGSSEGHQCYFYRRVAVIEEESEFEREEVTVEMAPLNDCVICPPLAEDPLFSKGIELLKTGREGMLSWINDFFDQANAGRTRHQKRILRERPMDSYYPTVKSHVVAASCSVPQKGEKRTTKATKRKINLRA
uniref:DOT1 domain-containing protein n=1 Tax=Peronospora matthiolae TaxID=2874970 RepID=A0AAV1V5F3_9STRA